MAIQTFKEIIDNNAYFISSKDRKIFEQGTLQSFFGFSDSDIIEFILYDVNDNQLPQQPSGNLVRYVPLTTENIRDYFLIPTGTYLQAFQFPQEYFIDAERLIREAGYNNGIFKIQITLLNKRVGSDALNDKMWIKEISPSKTEVKLLPLKTENSLKTDLLERFNLFISDGNFREDVQPFILNFLNSISVSDASGFIQKTYGDSWYNKFVSEFGISVYDEFITKIYNKFTEAMIYESMHRISNINDINYGKPKPTKKSIKLSVDDLFKIANTILIDCIKFYLPKRSIQYDSNSIEYVGTGDTPNTLVKSKTDVLIRPPKSPQITKKVKTIPQKEIEQLAEVKRQYDDYPASNIKFSKPSGVSTLSIKPTTLSQPAIPVDENG